MRNDNPPCFYEIYAFYFCPGCERIEPYTQDSRDVQEILKEKCEFCGYDKGLELKGIEK